MDAGAMEDTGDYEPFSMDTEKQSTVISKAPNSTALFQIQFFIYFLILVHACCYSLDTLHTLSFTVHVALV